MAKFANLTNHPLILPKPGGAGSQYIRPGESVHGPWWSRFVGPNQLSRVGKKYTPSQDFKPRRRPVATSGTIRQAEAAGVGDMTTAAALAHIKQLYERCFVSRTVKARKTEIEGALLQLGERAIPSPSITCFKDKHKGRRCFVIGNGPSLNATDLSKLRNEITFGCNMIFQHPQMNSGPTYYVCSDQHIAVYMNPIVSKWWRTVPKRKRFFHRPHRMRKITNKYIDILRAAMRDGRSWATTPRDDGRFHTDLVRGCGMGAGSAGYLLHLAYYMGCNPVYLVGLDCTFGEFKGVKYSHTLRKRLNKNKPLGRGYNMIFARHKQAKIAFEKAKRQVFNATKGGRLEVFPRVKYDEIV